MGFVAAVKVRGEEGWSYNSLVFGTHEEAEAWGLDLSRRWILVEKFEAQPTSEPVNYHFTNGELVGVTN
ncbi:hypothetical protein ES703_62003 [subsurface metagenome]